MTILKERRLKGGIPTQKEVAKALGVHSTSVSKWERGLAMPTVDKLPVLAKLYGCSIEDLIGKGETKAE